jgi:hypothetical protein
MKVGVWIGSPLHLHAKTFSDVMETTRVAHRALAAAIFNAESNARGVATKK